MWSSGHIYIYTNTYNIKQQKGHKTLALPKIQMLKIHREREHKTRLWYKSTNFACTLFKNIKYLSDKLHVCDNTLKIYLKNVLLHTVKKTLREVDFLTDFEKTC